MTAGITSVRALSRSTAVFSLSQRVVKQILQLFDIFRDSFSRVNFVKVNNSVLCICGYVFMFVKRVSCRNQVNRTVKKFSSQVDAIMYA